MEEIKNLFIKHFGFLPDIISTTEHACISPPSRIISCLTELLTFSSKKILRIIITDTYSIHPENYIKQICLPHILNKKLFCFDNNFSKKEFIQKFEEDFKKIKDILDNKLIFSSKEINNYIKLVNLYKKIFLKIEVVDSVIIYNNIMKMYSNELGLDILNEWLKNTNLFGIDSMRVRLFLRESFDFLVKNYPKEVNLFGKYLETKKRLKFKNDKNIIQIINWENYLYLLNKNFDSCFIPFEIVLYVYSYCGGSHFGNDYNMISDINKIRNNKNLSQITQHNKDFSFKIEENNVQFQKVSIIKDSWNLSHKMHKAVNTLSELFIILGQEDLKNKFKKQFFKNSL